MTFVGRRHELRALRDAFDAVGERTATVALVEGPAGMGKTSLMERFLSELDGARVVRASGDEGEREVAFGVVDQLLRAGGEPGLLAPEGPAGIDQVAVGLRLLELVGRLQDDGPVVVTVDDAQWADEGSLRALLFAVRRMVEDAVLILLVVRLGEASRVPEGLRKLATTVAVSPLHVDEIRALAEAEGAALSVPVARRLQAHTMGNPLYARALLQELPPEAWRDGGDALPAPRSFSELVIRRAERATPAARALADAAAVLGVRSRLADAAALAGFDEPLEPLEEAIEAGLLSTDARRETVSFQHPLVRAALYHDLGPAVRARLHRRAAARARSRVATLGHLVAATPAPDPALAKELEAVARNEARRGAGGVAAALLLDAGRFSADEDSHNRCVLEAADALLYVGRRADASAHLEAIAAMPDSPRRDLVLAQMAIHAGDLAEGERLLAEAWKRCDRNEEPVLAAAIALRSAYSFMAELRGPQTALWAGRALELSPAMVEAAGPLAWGLAISGDHQRARETLDRAVERLSRNAGGEGILRSLRGWLLLLRGDIDGALADLSDAAAATLRVGSTIAAVAGQAWLADAEFHAGRWEDATIHADRAVAISVASDEWLPSTSFAIATMSRLALERGDVEASADAVRRLDEHVPASAAERAIAAIEHARLLAARRGASASVLDLLGPVVAAPPGSALHEPGFFTWDSLYADALVALDRYDEADRFLGARERVADVRENAPAIARLARMRGWLEAARGDADAADAAFRHALERGRAAGMPYELALCRLAYGQFLRRQGRRRAAAEELGRARDRFAELGALPALERCEREIAASGLEPAKRIARDRFRLTPQETVVARLAASGMTNRQIARELLVSPKTVEVHLTRIYAKLGVNSRAQLPRLDRSSSGSESAPGDVAAAG